MLTRLDQRLNATTYGRAREQIQELIQHPEKWINARGLTVNQRAILKGGSVPKACFHKFVGTVPVKMRDDILDDLRLGEMVTHGFHGTGNKKCEVYWWIND